MSHRKITGIIWVGPVHDRGGYGNVSRNYILGLKKIGIPVRVVKFGETHEELDAETVCVLKQMEKTDVGSYPVGVIHYTPDLYPKVKFKNVARVIGCTIFETDRIPVKWVPLINEVDEIWVPSRFNYETFTCSGINPKKIRIIPYAVDTDFYKPTTETFPVDKKGFVFLYAFAFGWRKGFDILLEAYCKEFTSSHDVTLILKVYGWGTEREDIRKMILDSVRDRVNLDDKNLPHFVIMDTSLNQHEMRKLYNTCDVYISTDRANGWGMPCMEMMAMGKPAASINWSGSTEFMNGSNSLLIKPGPRMVPVDSRLSQTLPELYAGHLWPEVDINEVRRVLRFAFEHRDVTRDIAYRGRKDMQEKYSLPKVAERIEVLLNELAGNRPCYSLMFGKPSVRVEGASV